MPQLVFGEGSLLGMKKLFLFFFSRKLVYYTLIKEE